MRRIRTARWLALLLASLVSLPAWSQPELPASAPDLKDLLSGQQYPLSLKLKDLNGDWRRITIGGSSETALWMRAFAAALGGAAAFYTKGESVSVGGETYLVAYSAEWKGGDVAALMRGAGDGDGSPPEPLRLTPETPLALSLLNVRTIGSIHDVHVFNLDQELAESRQAASGGEEATSAGRLRHLGMALQAYVQDYDQFLPPMQDVSSAATALEPYVRNRAVFEDPESRQSFQPNALLSYRRLADIRNPESTIAFYEAAPDAEGARDGVYLDGQVRRLTDMEWQAVDREIKEGLRREAVNTTSLERLRVLGQALLRYVRDRRGALPARGDPLSLKNALKRYTQSEATFVHPQLGEPYALNPHLAGRAIGAFGSPAQTVAFYEATAAADGLGAYTRGVVFLSGRAKRLPEAEWEQLKRRLRIP